MVAISRSSSSVPLAERAALSVREASAYAGIGRTTLYDLIEKQVLRSVKVGSRRLVLRQSIDELLSQADA